MFGTIVMYTLCGLIGAGVVALFLYMVVIGPMLGKKELARMERELPELAARRVSVSAAVAMTSMGSKELNSSTAWISTTSARGRSPALRAAAAGSARPFVWSHSMDAVRDGGVYLTLG